MMPSKFLEDSMLFLGSTGGVSKVPVPYSGSLGRGLDEHHARVNATGLLVHTPVTHGHIIIIVATP